MRARLASRSVGILTVLVVLSLLTAAATLVLIARTTSSETVQGAELDLAGRQRRLSERIAYDVAHLGVDSGDVTVREELRSAAEMLDAIHTGLVDGDPALGLDGVLPETVRDLYTLGGLDLSNRLTNLALAATAIADTPGPPAGQDVELVLSEASGERLVNDLNQMVTTLAEEQHAHEDTHNRILTAGLALYTVLGLLSAAALVFVRRTASRQVATSEALAQEVARSEALYRTTVDSLIDGVVIQDDQGNVVRVNNAARKIIAEQLDGRTPTVGRSFADFLPQMLGEDGEPLTPAFRPIVRALASAEPVVGQIVGLRNATGMHWYRCNATATTDPDTGARWVALAFSDITAERKLEVSLRDQERRFRLALEHAPIGIALVDQAGQFISVNKELCELTGRSQEELMESDLFAMAHPDDPHLGPESLAWLVAGDRDLFQTERRILTADGSTIETRIAMSVVRPDDETEPYFIAKFVDISEDLRSEEAQRDALERERDMVAKLVALDETKTTFVSTVSHELRTPLTSLIGYLEVLGDGSAGPVTERQLSMLDAAERNGQRLLRLIEDLLTITTMDRLEVKVVSTPIDVARMIESVVEAVSPLATQGDVSTVIEIDPRSHTLVGDEPKLERVLMNVIGNAIKFTPPNGTVTIGAAPAVDDPTITELSVADTGIGIPEDEQDQLFTRFFRSSSAQSQHIPGTGLGLAIAATLVEAHNGTISVSSVENLGTTVTIRLPGGPGITEGAAVRGGFGRAELSSTPTA